MPAAAPAQACPAPARSADMADERTIFPAGGMADRLRKHFGSGTDLGDPQGWPASLRAAATLMLDSGGPVWLAWGSGLTFLYNDAYAPLLGSKHPLAMGRKLAEVWAEVWAEVAPLVAQALAGSPVTRRDMPFEVSRGRGPEAAFFTFAYTPLRDDDGQVAGLFCTVAETTEEVGQRQRRADAEAALKRVNLALEQAVESHSRDRSQLWEVSRDLFCIADLRGRVVAVNPAWERTLGYPQREFVGRTLEWLEHPDDRPKTRAALRQLRREQVNRAFENRYRDRQGNDHTLSWTAVRKDDQLYCAARDVSEERAREAALRDSQDFARLALSAVGGVGVWTYDAATDVFFFDPQIAALYALDPADGPGGLPRTAFLANVHPDDRRALAATMAGGLVRAGDLELEYRVCHPDGTVRWVLSRGHTYHDADGRPLRRIGVGVETTSHRQMEEALRQSQKMEAIGQLTGGVAHDFNNLLTVIRACVDLLARPNLPEARRARYVTAIADTTDRAARLTAQLLAFARRQALKPEVFAACDAVRGIADMVRTLVGSQIRLAINLPAERCYINADPSQFDTALVNMAANARDAIGGDGEITITVRPVDEKPAFRAQPAIPGRFVAISLQDSGSGIPEDRLDRIFEPFFTTKEVGKGTGLGLSQVFGFARQSHGDVSVASVVGEGTTFVLYLPQVAAARPAMAAPGPAGAADDGHNTCVLLVEDNAEVGTFAMQALIELGYLPILAANAAEALAELARGAGRFDVVFSDILMPGMSGIELGQEINALYPSLPVVLTSGYSQALAVTGTGGFPLLQKPYSIEQLSQILRDAIAAVHG